MINRRCQRQVGCVAGRGTGRAAGIDAGCRAGAVLAGTDAEIESAEVTPSKQMLAVRSLRQILATIPQNTTDSPTVSQFVE